MHRLVCIAAVLGTAVVAVPAGAARVTFGSNLRAPATIIEAHQADSAFWPTAIAGGNWVVPADGQILRIRLRGTVLRERGAGYPLNEVHFQTLRPNGDGTMVVVLTSAPFYVPIGDDPDRITSYRPENLCAKRGDVIAFNDEGGFQYGGPGRLEPGHYDNGAPFRVFGAVEGSTTAHYSKHDGTFNGDTLYPTSVPGEELLMQVVLGTGADASEPCGGPRRHPNGRLVGPPPPAMHVIVPQKAYVSSDLTVSPAVYCNEWQGCSGIATLTHGRRALATSAFAIRGRDSGRIGFSLQREDYEALKAAPHSIWAARLTLDAGALGRFSSVIAIRH